MKKAEHRVEIIRRYVVKHIEQTRETWDSFAYSVFKHYDQTVPVDDRHIELSYHPDLEKRLKAWGRRLERMVTGRGAYFLLELEDSVIAALPAEKRADLITELGALWGVAAVQVPVADPGIINLQQAGLLAKEFAETMTPLSGALADGELNMDDLHHLERLAINGRQLAAVAMTVAARAEALLSTTKGRIRGEG